MVQQNLNTGVLPSPAMLVWPNPVTKELARAVSGSVRAFTCPPEGHRVTARIPLASLSSWSQILVGKRPELNSWPSRKSPEQKKILHFRSQSFMAKRQGQCQPGQVLTPEQGRRTMQSILAFLPPWKGIPTSRYCRIAVLSFLQGLAV